MEAGAPWLALMDRASVHDVEGVLALCHPEVAWETRFPGLDPVFYGPEGVRAFFVAFEEAIADVQASFRVLAARGERVLLEVRLAGHGRGSGTPAEMTVFDVWTFREGLLLRRQTFYERAAGLDELAREA